MAPWEVNLSAMWPAHVTLQMVNKCCLLWIYYSCYCHLFTSISSHICLVKISYTKSKFLHWKWNSQILGILHSVWLLIIKAIFLDEHYTDPRRWLWYMSLSSALGGFALSPYSCLALMSHWASHLAEQSMCWHQKVPGGCTMPGKTCECDARRTGTSSREGLNVPLIAPFSIWLHQTFHCENSFQNFTSKL